MAKKKEKKTKLSILIIGLILGVIAIIGAIIPIFKSINFGLDLQGGFEVLYKLESLEGDKVTSDMANATYKTLSRRVDVLGVSEPEIVIEGTDKIRVKLAGVKNPDEAREILGKAANLTFRDTSDNLLMNSSVLKSGGAKSGRDENGLPVVSLSVKDKDKFYEQTLKVSQKQDNRIVIWLDFDEEKDSFSSEQRNCGNGTSNCLSAATVNQGFASDVIIQGNFTSEEVTELVDLINSGSMPTKLTEISSRTVDASFGEGSLYVTLTAGVIGIVLIMALMIAIYKVAGVISSVSIMLYTFLVFLTFYLIGGVLTLPGIAALVLGIGMAVDSNVLTFERIKEELKTGRNLKTAFVEGSKRSFTTILDSNLTTLLVAIILFIFGESSVKGFATMLIISIVVTILSMVFITKWILKKFVNTGKFDNKVNLLFGLKSDKIKNINKSKEKKTFDTKVNIDFVKPRKKLFIFSSLVIVLGAVFTLIYGFNLSIDYKGGSSVTISGEKKLSQKQIKNYFEENDYTVSDISYINEETGVYLKLNETMDQKEIEKVITDVDNLDKSQSIKTDIGVVSNIVKKELTKNAILSIVFAAIGIVIYVGIRYTFNYAISAIIALLHDALFVVALFSIFRLEVSTIFIAAILAIIGYSINNTIVVFDRIRENISDIYEGQIKTKEQLFEVVNISLRQTFFRSLMTTITTLLPVIMLLFFGSHSIFEFNIAMLMGLIVGTYSSLFIASQIWYELEKKHVGKNRKEKKRFFDVDDDDELDEKVIVGLNK